MQVRFLLGPSGSGKTFRCLEEARRVLAASPAGLPLLFLAPKQATFQLERQLLSRPELAGYTRLKILSFERLAQFILTEFEESPPPLLNEEGRLMVLRALLSRRRRELSVFHATSRLPGFAQELSAALRELQRAGVSLQRLSTLAHDAGEHTTLGRKLKDLASIYGWYLDWLRERALRDADELLEVAADALKSRASGVTRVSTKGFAEALSRQPAIPARWTTPDTLPPANVRKASGLTAQNNAEADRTQAGAQLRFEGLWLDGFAELSAQEMNLLAALLPCCDRATLTFNLDPGALSESSWLSPWSVPSDSLRKLRQRLAGEPEIEVVEEVLDREAPHTRFGANRILRHLEKHWAQPAPWSSDTGATAGAPEVKPRSDAGAQLTFETLFQNEAEICDSPQRFADGGAENSCGLSDVLRVAVCTNPEAEAIFAAREILRFMRSTPGARFRDIAVLVRRLEQYHDPVRRIFERYEIPLFVDRREPVGHHPLVELTRSALRTVACQWRAEDWFGALKTGLVFRDESAIDRLENEALARGWKGDVWLHPLEIEGASELAAWLEKLRLKLVPPFAELAGALAGATAPESCITGTQLAAALRSLWQTLGVEAQLESWTAQSGNPVHTTLWDQMQEWLVNLELAFADERLPLREWLPIVDAGLSHQTVGVIPPTLDQVLLGAIDRSRNPDLELTIVLGMNESVFPSVPAPPTLLTQTDRSQLFRFGIELGPSLRAQLSFERYLGYVACTRARRRLVIGHSVRDLDGKPLTPSPFLDHLRRLFPSLPIETFSANSRWLDAEHPTDLLPALMQYWFGAKADAGLESVARLPVFSQLGERAIQRRVRETQAALSPFFAEQLYGTTLKTSVSRLEEFAACPFRFFVRSGLRADERKRFELDARERGSFQHLVLAEFHQQLQREGKRWRDLTPAEARERIGRIAEQWIPRYQNGLFQADDRTAFTARLLTASLQDFIEVIVGWMSQYLFDPCAVELAFGLEAETATGSAAAMARHNACHAGEPPNSHSLPAWEIDLGDGHRLSFRGKIDRVDLWRENPQARSARCVVIDYKAGNRKLDSALIEHGIQLQLLAYLNVLRALDPARELFGVEALIPAGVFYVSLRPAHEPGKTRNDVLSDAPATRRKAYRHTGRFDRQVLELLDCRPGIAQGDQFHFRLNRDGTIHGGDREPMETQEFLALLDSITDHLKRMGRAIFAGDAAVDPYRKGSQEVACTHCDYRSICRIDPWTHRYRVLRAGATD